MISAPDKYANLIALATFIALNPPDIFDVCIDINLVLGATPETPWLLSPTAAIIPAQAVPCFSMFHTGAPPELLPVTSSPKTIFDIRSGCVNSIPWSITAVIIAEFPFVIFHAFDTFISIPGTPPFCPVLLNPHCEEKNVSSEQNASIHTNSGSENSNKPVS